MGGEYGIVMEAKNKALASGWICPNCRAVNSPYKLTCNCGPSYEISVSNTGAIVLKKIDKNATGGIPWYEY